MARLPKQDEAPRRTAFLGVHLTPAERAKIERRAASAGLRVSEWQRRVMLSDRAEPAPAASDPKAVQALRAAIIHLGNNWNQLTARANVTGHLPSQKVLQEVGAAIIAALRKVREL
jgi:hypothetical protein